MKYDHFSMLPERAFQPRNGRMNMTLEGGGGGGQTTSTVTQSNIPEWLRPQTEALLGAATQEYFETTPRKLTKFKTETRVDEEGNTTEVQVPDGTEMAYDITGIRPFTPYSTDPSQYVAGFTPEQKQVFSKTANLQTPGAFGAAGQLMGAGGRGGLESVRPAYGYGQQGQQSGFLGQQLGVAGGEYYGGLGANIGRSYGQMATDPSSIAAYMSPYQQGVTDIAKAQAIEDAKKSQLGANLGAVRQGTYGGARQTLAQAQREAALQKQLGDIQTQGLQSAYDRAVQAQQFGVSAGMQGAGIGLQGVQQQLSGVGQGLQGAQVGLQGLGAAQAGYGMAGQLGQGLTGLGQTQQASDLARLGFQAEIGALPQAQRQAIIDQSIQNFAFQQENPYQRMSQFSGLLRGYATPTTTTEQYGGSPNTLQTLGALGTAAGGVGTLMGAGKKAGGVIKLAGGGGITDKDALESFAERSSIPQLQQSMQSGSLPKYIGMPILENEVAKAERMKMNQMLMAQGQQQGRPSISDEIEAKANQLQGITDIATGAGGGIVAFAGGDVVKGGLNLSPTEIKKYIDQLKKQGADPKTIEAVKRNPSLLSRIISKTPKTGLAGIVGIPGMMATDALMSTDTGVGDEADIMFSGIEPGAGGPRTARNALEAGQELLGAVIPSGPGTETRAAQAEIDAQRETQSAPPVSPTYPDESQRGIVPGPTAPTATKPGASKGKPKDEISAALDGITSVGQDAGGAPQQSLKDFADQYLKDRTAYAGEDALSNKLKERAEKESSFFDRLSSGSTQIGLAGSALRDPSRYGEYMQQAAGLRQAESKAKDEREMDYLKALDRERQNRITAFDKSEQRMSDKDKQSAQFKHEKQLNNDRLKVQSAGIKVQQLVAEATAANTRELKKASELRQYTEFFAEQPIKINRLFDDKLKALKDSNDYMSLKPEEQRQQVEAIEAARRLELDKLDKLKQDTMHGGYKIVAQR
jgi:hypothetical protein